jgi:hypothetical protein
MIDASDRIAVIVGGASGIVLGHVMRLVEQSS